METKISRCMSTQHPDNVAIPFFSDSPVLQGESEVREAYYVFSNLGCREQMWDYEGKEVDAFVLEKLLSRYDYFFKEKVMGEDVFITLRVPNPTVDKSEGKILLETLESIPRNYDIASKFYKGVTPIFEVILPMTTSHRELQMVYSYYRDMVAGKGAKRMSCGVTVSEWIGEFKPKEISVIPLFENYESLLGSARIVKEYLMGKRLEYQRVFLARSDPALNYGAACAVILNKIALQRLQALEEELSVDLPPIVGAGSAPFRGNLKPTNVGNCLLEYPSAQTFTIQSAFKYDYPEETVRLAIEHLNNSTRKKAYQFDEEPALRLMKKLRKEYASQIALLHPLINRVSKHMPVRRSRKLHIGLFGYPRMLDRITLPRAIPFCASLYSLGLPPEMLGLSALGEKDFDQLKEIYLRFEEDLRDALQFFNKGNLKYLPRALGAKLAKVQNLVDFAVDEEHEKSTTRMMGLVRKGDFSSLREEIEKAGHARRFLG